MPGYVLAADAFGLILAVVGFTMAFRQTFVRRLLGRPDRPASRLDGAEDGDPLTYVLRIAGVMIMVFGVVLGGMFTLFQLA